MTCMSKNNQEKYFVIPGRFLTFYKQSSSTIPGSRKKYIYQGSYLTLTKTLPKMFDIGN